MRGGQQGEKKRPREREPEEKKTERERERGRVCVVCRPLHYHLDRGSEPAQSHTKPDLNKTNRKPQGR